MAHASFSSDSTHCMLQARCVRLSGRKGRGLCSWRIVAVKAQKSLVSSAPIYAPSLLRCLSCRNIMSNNTAFGTAQPPKRPAGPPSSSADVPKEGSSAPADPEWEAARYTLALLPCAFCESSACQAQAAVMPQSWRFCMQTDRVAQHGGICKPLGATVTGGTFIILQCSACQEVALPRSVDCHPSVRLSQEKQRLTRVSNVRVGPSNAVFVQHCNLWICSGHYNCYMSLAD